MGNDDDDEEDGGKGGGSRSRTRQKEAQWKREEAEIRRKEVGGCFCGCVM